MSQASSSNWTSPGAVARFVLTAAIGLTTDLLVKHWADLRLAVAAPGGPMPSVDVLPGWLKLEWTPNHGAALGFFQGYRWVFLIVSAAAVGFLGYLFTISLPKQRGYQFILGMLLAGVLGNLFDRAALGYVRDMIHIFPGRRWPPEIAAHLPWFWTTPELFPWIFNLADSFLCVGVTLMLIHSLIHASPAPVDFDRSSEDVQCK
jgi:signal peptidase II